MNLMARTTLALGGAVALGIASIPSAQAVDYFTTSTTGAQARAYIDGASVPNVVVQGRDPLTDGHCAQVQYRYSTSGSWTNAGAAVCTSTWTTKAKLTAPSTLQVRVCRTGVGNCSSPFTVNL